MIKLIASDMDGTLIRDNGRIHHKIFPLIELLRSKRIIFAAASGRFYHQLDDNFKNVNSKMIFIAHNGALVKYNNNGDTIFSSPISLENITGVLNLQRNFGEEIFLACENIAYAVNPTSEMYDLFKSFNIPFIPYNPISLNEPVYKITYYNDHGVKEDTIKYLQNNLSSDLDFVVSGDKWIDIMNKGTNKGSAIKILQEKFGIDKENTMVFGDYYNDLSMFKTAHFSYAMKNAPEDVKDKANFIADSNNENGVYNVIYKFASSL